MLDPLIVRSIAIAFALLFALAALHKLKDREGFQHVLVDYQVVPEGAVPLLAALIPISELLLAAAWLVIDDVSVAALLSGSLLILYTGAVLLNLMRGRIHIGCGCGFPGTVADEQPLSYSVVGRNLALIAVALSAMLPVTERALTVVDHAVLAGLLLTSALLYAGINQLMKNNAAIGSWRNRHD